MTSQAPYFVIAYYNFVTLEDPREEVRRHKKFFEGRDVRGRIYISGEGINCQMSASVEDTEAYVEWIKGDERLADTHFKLDPYPEHAFAKMTVKYREQLAAMDTQVDLSKGGEHVSPEQWKEMLESDEDYLLLDVRNDYEWEVGHFEGAERPNMQTFREFPGFAKALKDKVDPQKKKVMMYCTGGIRCELYSALMKEEGFEKIYQLQGGVIHYGHEQGSKHWKGKLFVFDDRMTVPISDEASEVIGKCHFCETSADHPYNCANMDCNKLFLCCPDCLDEHQGCCQATCQESERCRPLEHQQAGKPFRKWYHYGETKEACRTPVGSE